jgi:tubulin polyglutamylase TTLL6/13
MRNYEDICLQGLLAMPREVSSHPSVKVDLTHTEYPVVRTVALEMFGYRGWRRKEDKKEEVTLVWRDTYINEEFLRKMLPFQKVNRFPGSYELGKKSNLTLNLRRMARFMSKEYEFYPRTWIVPKEQEEFRKFAKGSPSSSFIAKPEAGCQGRGILLLARPLEFQPTETMVVQEYIRNPLLIDNLKFDVRLYVLLKSV